MWDEIYKSDTPMMKKETSAYKKHRFKIFASACFGCEVANIRRGKSDKELCSLCPIFPEEKDRCYINESFYDKYRYYRNEEVADPRKPYAKKMRKYFAEKIRDLKWR